MFNIKSLELILCKREMLIEKYTTPLVNRYNDDELSTTFVWTNKNNEIHRLNNLPAVITKTKTEYSLEYCVNGVYHRNYDLPSTINLLKVFPDIYFDSNSIYDYNKSHFKVGYSKYHLEWRVKGVPSRLRDQHHKLDTEGARMWINSKGELHRENDMPAHITKSGTLSWYKNGQHFRRKDKPTVIRHDYTLVFYDQNVPLHVNCAHAMKYYKERIKEDRRRSGIKCDL